jgi:metal-dependent amidase/aminoacylase/carboxypeptidase family protein
MAQSSSNERLHSDWSQLVANLQQIVSRRVNPVESAVISVGSFAAHNAFNVIADSAKLIGTVRTFNPEVRNLMEREMERVIQGTCISNDCTYEFLYERGYNAVVNHEAETHFLKEVAEQIPGVRVVRESEQHMGGEDFLDITLKKCQEHFSYRRSASRRCVPPPSS